MIRRNLSMMSLVVVLIAATWFAVWETRWRDRNARAEAPALRAWMTLPIASSPIETPLLAAQLTSLADASPLATPDPSPTQDAAEIVSPVLEVTRIPPSQISPLPTPTRVPPRPTSTPDLNDALVPRQKTPTPPPPDNINGIAVDKFVVMPDSVKANIRQIYARGQALGHNPRAFSKMGDSTIENPYFMTRFDGGPYKLGEYAYLQPIINHFAGSFSRQSMTVRVGLHSWSMLNPMWADKALCLPNESPAACEFRLHKPVLVIIRLGANDADTPQLFKENMQQILTYTIESGVIPVLGTKADRFRDPENRFNNIIRQLAADYNVPLWDFDLVAQTLPGSGLGGDGVHMTDFFEHDYTQPEAFKRGHSVHNLSALVMLDRLWRELVPTNK